MRRTKLGTGRQALLIEKWSIAPITLDLLLREKNDDWGVGMYGEVR